MQAKEDRATIVRVHMDTLGAMTDVSLQRKMGGSANTPDSTPGLGPRINLEGITAIWRRKDPDIKIKNRT